MSALWRPTDWPTAGVWCAPPQAPRPEQSPSPPARVALSHVLAAGETGSPTTIEVEQQDVLALAAGADLLKLDVEGAEWPILGDPRFVADPPRVVAMEYHAIGAPGPDPRAEAERLLRAAGLQTADIRRHAHGDGMLWAWRR